MTIWEAVLLGLVQGIAEFLPISSSGHLSVVNNLFKISEEGHMFLMCCSTWEPWLQYLLYIGRISRRCSTRSYPLQI